MDALSCNKQRSKMVDWSEAKKEGKNVSGIISV